MSHIVSIKTEIRDAAAVRAACQRLGLTDPVVGSHPLYSGTAHGHAVQLRGWRYPVVCDLESGGVAYDNFEGRWGDSVELDRFKQSYAIEKAKIEARKNGHTVVEQAQADGSVKLVIGV